MLNVKKNYKLKVLLLVAVIAFALGSCTTSTKDDHYNASYGRGTAANTLILELKKQGFTSFVAALEKTKYSVTLASPKSFTVFAPSNEDFDKAISGLSDDEIKTLVGYHIIEPAFSRVRLVDTVYKTVSGKYMRFDPKNMLILTQDGIKEAAFTNSEISCDNGIIQPITTTLKPLKSIASVLKTNYPLFYKILTEGFIRDTTYRNYQSAFDEEGNPYVDSAFAKAYDYINPFDEKTKKTVLAVSDATINSTIGPIEKAFKGSSMYSGIMHYWYNKMLKKHFYKEPLYTWHFENGRIPISETSYVDLEMYDKASNTDRMKVKNLLTSNGLVHEYDSIMNDFTWQAYLDSAFLNDYAGFNIEYQPWADYSFFTSFVTGNRSILKPTKFALNGKYYEPYVDTYPYLFLFANRKVDSVYNTYTFRSEVEPLSPLKSVDVVIPNVPGARFMVSLSFPGGTNSIVQMSIDGVNIGKPFDLRKIYTSTTAANPFGDEKFRALVGKGAYNYNYPDIYLGEVNFASFGKRTVRFTIIGTSATSQYEMESISAAIGSIRFTPMAPNSKK